MGTDLRLTAAVELQAADAGGKLPRVSILAYSGGIVDVSGYGPTLIDLAGLKMDGIIPLLADHNSTLDGVAGSGTPRVERGTLHVEGTVAPTTPAGSRIRELAAAGVPLQASVGVAPADRLAVRAGDKVKANGREHTAGPRGLILVRRGQLREVSITPLGADPSTTVSVAARGQTMPNELRTEDDTETTIDPIQAERQRVREIRAACRAERDGPAYYRPGLVDDIEARAIDEGWDRKALSAALLDGLRASRWQGSSIPRGDVLPSGNPRDILTASCMLMGGHGEAIVKAFPGPLGERLANGVERPSGWPELAALALRAEGQPIPRDRHDLIRAAFSTTNLPVAIGSSVQKVALNVFLEASANFLALARVVAASDFKPGKALRLSAASGFERIGPNGELKHGDLGEDAFDFKVDTFGRIFGIDRQTLINDDASILSDIPTILGGEAARSVSDLFFDTLIGNGGSWFGTGNGNLQTGADSALSIGSLATAIKVLRTRTDRDGRIIGFTPTVLLVPAALEAPGRQILNSTTLQRDQAADNQATGNPLAGLDIGLVVEPRLDADSATAWYLFSRPQHGAILLATLGGRLGATVENIDPPANMLGTYWRGFMDFGVSLAEYRAAVKANGAA